MQDSPSGCLWCGQPFAASRADARYCSASHRVSASRARRRDEHALSALDAARESVRHVLSADSTQGPSAIHAALFAGVAELVDAALADVRLAFARSTDSRRGGQTAQPPR